MSHKHNNIMIRRAEAPDTLAVIEILERTRFFRPGEIIVARELLDAAVRDAPGGEYQSFVALVDGNVTGWICFGPTACTLGTFDIYWVAVDPAAQRRGLGKAMTDYVTDIIKRRSGRMIAVDTSGTDRYAPTRRFYEKLGFTRAATVTEFYAPGDDKIIYIKRL
jgi:ribosomal protein S18 acetylase RimI-like enzyme